MRKEDSHEKQAGETAKTEADALRARFPDPETDERLQAPAASDLPPVPEVTFTRPNTQTARGYKSAPKRRPTADGGGQQQAGPAEDKAGEYRNMGIATTIGFSLVGSIIAGTILGLLADHYLIHSVTPWGLILGFLAGVLSGFISLIRVTNRLNR